MVTEDATGTPDPFDVPTVKALVALMSRHDLSEIDLRHGERRIRLRRGVRSALPAEAPVQAVPAPAPNPGPAAAAPPAKSEAPAPAPAKKLLEIKSPTPGTFYSAPSPGAEPFVRIGSRVSPTTVVCVIEAMKVFNEITADVSGVITAVRIENSQAVEYGQVLFLVDPAG